MVVASDTIAPFAAAYAWVAKSSGTGRVASTLDTSTIEPRTIGRAGCASIARVTARATSAWLRRFSAIVRSQPLLKPGDVVTHRIEQACAALQRGEPVGCGPAFAEQALEDDPRMRFGRQGSGGRGP